MPIQHFKQYVALRIFVGANSHRAKTNVFPRRDVINASDCFDRYGCGISFLASQRLPLHGQGRERIAVKNINTEYLQPLFVFFCNTPPRYRIRDVVVSFIKCFKLYSSEREALQSTAKFYDGEEERYCHTNLRSFFYKALMDKTLSFD